MCSLFAPPSAATLTEAAVTLSLVTEKTQQSGELRTVLPELAQVDAVLQRLVKNEKSEVLADVIVLEQLCWSPFKGL